MDFILSIIFLGLAIVVIAYIVKYFTGKKIISTNEIFQQRDVTVNYVNHTIQIKKRTFDIGLVTGISLITQSNGNRRNYALQINVDDIEKPVFMIPIIGSQRSADEFMQRVCVAIRKAGGPDFH